MGGGVNCKMHHFCMELSCQGVQGLSQGLEQAQPWWDEDCAVAWWDAINIDTPQAWKALKKVTKKAKSNYFLSKIDQAVLKCKPHTLMAWTRAWKESMPPTLKYNSTAAVVTTLLLYDTHPLLISLMLTDDQ